ncbi:enoyl-CoA hydratase/isomerase family protein [Frankia gtarii]|uniref:enoyl-CoA hydratase/isomerase family protein n=1 Tax=Frankia gtarii TaxID=2950102 RepID=UPI0021C0958D|nr:enoyl-CoA hydratase/isomerase family protein [Frankia gtarii]
MYSTLLVERRGPVGWLIFDRPAAGNAMDAVMFTELPRAWAELDADPAVGVIVNTGAGRRFQTGLDLAQLSRDPAALREQSRQTRRAQLRLTGWQNGVSKPVIAAVNGLCVGGGLHFVADADIVIAASDAEFTDTHVSVGQATAFEGITLSRRIAAETVMRMALSGRHERLGAARAYQLGMISEVVDPPSALRDRAQELAETLARNSPAAMAATKRALWGALEAGLTDACHAGAAELVSMWGHPDQLEGPAAFAQRREPRWGDSGDPRAVPGAVSAAVPAAVPAASGASARPHRSDPSAGDEDR